jgi:hypothetical protein
VKINLLRISVAAKEYTLKILLYFKGGGDTSVV